MKRKTPVEPLISFMPGEVIHPLRNCNKAEKTTLLGVALFYQIHKSSQWHGTFWKPSFSAKRTQIKLEKGQLNKDDLLIPDVNHREDKLSLHPNPTEVLNH